MAKMKRNPSYIKDSPYKLYLLIRDDLPSMNPGRGMAQAAHAANQCIFEYGKDRRIKEWQGTRGFGTTITLSVHDMQLQNIIDEAKKKGHIAELVYDPTYGYSLHMEIASCIDKETFTGSPIFKNDGQVVLFRNELTCGYIFIHEDHPDREGLVGALLLHP